MSTGRLGITLKQLLFTGPQVVPADLQIASGLNVLFGASNTGKSFAVKALDFMLGSSRDLPDIGERRGYNRVWLELDLPKSGLGTLIRSLSGGAFEYFDGDIDLTGDDDATIGRTLSARHDPSSGENLSALLLNELGLLGREIAVDANGKKRSVSFRDLARYCIVDETAIQSEVSPALSGQNMFVTAERSIFKLLLTGTDDSAIVPVVDRKTFKASTAGKLEVVDELIASIDDELAADFPNAEQLVDQSSKIEVTWRAAENEFERTHGSIRERLATKRALADTITRLQARQAEIQINIGRFEQLSEVYQSDIGRLEAIEEAGFYLTVGQDQACPLCGALPEHQVHIHGLNEIEQTRAAADSEIAKIRLQAIELEASLSDLDTEGRAVAERLSVSYQALANLEAEIDELTPAANNARERLQDILKTRDHIRRGLALMEQRNSLRTRRDELSSAKPAAKAEKPQLGLPTSASHEFAQVVSEVLAAWQFPGNRHVTFDDSTFDLKIDGKHRRDNGKGVRAITHAAFKVALVLFCRDRNLPHPGFLVLDTPLLTYRDPVHSREGALAEDEVTLRNTTLKDFFFEHLSRQGDRSQFIVVENVELPNTIASLANVETFTGDLRSGRAGLFRPS